MARPKNEKLEIQRREEILQAASRVFRAKGFHLARTEDICTEAKTSAGTLFRYFKSKKEIIEAIVEAEMKANDEDLLVLAQRQSVEGLAKLTAEELQEMLRPGGYGLATESWLELSRSPDGRKQLAASSAKLEAALAALLAQGQAEGWVRRDLNAKGAANLLLIVYTGVQFDADLGMDIDYEASAQAISDLIKSFILTS